MSHRLTTNKPQHRHPKIYFKQFLYNASEPRDDISHDTPAEHEAELMENSYFMRRRFRHNAQRIRNRFK